MKLKYHFKYSVCSPLDVEEDDPSQNNNVYISRYLVELIKEVVPRDMYVKFETKKGDVAHTWIYISDDEFVSDFKKFIEKGFYSLVMDICAKEGEKEEVRTSEKDFTPDDFVRCNDTTIKNYNLYFRLLCSGGEGDDVNMDRLVEDRRECMTRAGSNYDVGGGHWFQFGRVSDTEDLCGKWQIFFKSHVYKMYIFTKLALAILNKNFSSRRYCMAVIKTDLHLGNAEGYNQELIVAYCKGSDFDATDESEDYVMETEELIKLLKQVGLDFNQLRIEYILYRPDASTKLGRVRVDGVKNMFDADENLVHPATEAALEKYREIGGDDKHAMDVVEEWLEMNADLQTLLRMLYRKLRVAFVASMDSNYELDKEHVSFYSDYDKGYKFTGGDGGEGEIVDVNHGWKSAMKRMIHSKIIKSILILICCVVVVVVVVVVVAVSSQSSSTSSSSSPVSKRSEEVV